MSADLLREAAALMRERAQAALSEAPTPWVIEQDWIDFGVPDRSQSLKDSRGLTLARVDIIRHVTDSPGPHIAAWHPAVALAVAEWMESEANKDDDGRKFTGHGGVQIIAADAGAFAVARAYLGRTEDGAQ